MGYIREMFKDVPLPSIDSNLVEFSNLAIRQDMYWIQQKYDGHRVLLILDNTGFFLQNKLGQPYSKTVNPNVIEAIHRLRSTLVGDTPTEIAFDCELMPSGLIVFDCPMIRSEKVKTGPNLIFEDRESIYHSLLSINEIDHIYPAITAKSMKEKVAFISQLIDMNAEGYIVKERKGQWSLMSIPSRKPRAMKGASRIKFVHDVDAIVMHQRGEKDSVAVGLFDIASKKLIEIGACSTIGKGAIKQGDVVKVRYLYVGADGRLVQPRIIEVREDKKAIQCTTDQALSHVNKDVVLDYHRKLTVSLQ